MSYNAGMIQNGSACFLPQCPPDIKMINLLERQVADKYNITLPTIDIVGDENMVEEEERTLA